jgi:hypothetical protein
MVERCGLISRKISDGKKTRLRIAKVPFHPFNVCHIKFVGVRGQLSVAVKTESERKDRRPAAQNACKWRMKMKTMESERST